MTTLYVGIDVSLEQLDVAMATTPESRKFLGRYANSPVGWQLLQAELAGMSEVESGATIQLLVEPTGGYEAELIYFAYRQGWKVSLVNPLQLRRWAEGQGQRAKTDRQDALLLAWFGAVVHPAIQDEMDEGAAQLDELLRRRHDLEQLRQAEQNRLGQLQRRLRPNLTVRRSLERTIRTLEEELQEVEEAIQQLLKNHAYLQQQRQLLRSSPAIGEKLSLELLVVCHRFSAHTSGQGTSKQLVAFLGLDPQPHESGKSKPHSRISRQGNSRLRAQLYCGALGGIRGNNPLQAFYHRLLGVGKAKKLALVACARKVLTWVWALFTSNTPFDPSRFSLPHPSPS